MTDEKDYLRRLEELLSKNMQQINTKILVLSNKGGVGKSFVAVNIAVGLSKRKANVGLLDADLHGPSVAMMLGFEGKKLPQSQNGIAPYLVNSNLVAISMASFLDNPDAPIIWRGPLKTSVLRQLLAEVNWGKLDYLIIDSPPGTGDEPLSVCQLIQSLTGAIVVTTPQDISLLDVKKCINFLRHLSIPILGIVENMSGFTCPHCGKNIDIFKSGGGEKAAKELGVPFLGRIPFDPRIVEISDNSRAFVEVFPDTEPAKVIEEICSIIEQKVKKTK